MIINMAIDDFKYLAGAWLVGRIRKGHIVEKVGLSRNFVTGILLAALVVLSGTLVSAQPASTANTVLILETSVLAPPAKAQVPPTIPPDISLEHYAALKAGFDVEVVGPLAWGAKSMDDFATYRAIILGDPHCGFTPSPGDPHVADIPGTATLFVGAAEANVGVWGPAVDGNVVLIGTDPTWHSQFGDALSGKEGGGQLTESGIAFVGNDPVQTGAYISLSCYYHGAPANTLVPVLDGLVTPGAFTVRGVPGFPQCFDDAHIVAAHASLAGLTDADLVDWECSVHNAFDSWPPSFQVLAISLNTGQEFKAQDGTVGTPYILARGVTPIPPPSCVQTVNPAGKNMGLSGFPNAILGPFGVFRG